MGRGRFTPTESSLDLWEAAKFDIIAQGFPSAYYAHALHTPSPTHIRERADAGGFIYRTEISLISIVRIALMRCLVIHRF